MFERRGKAFLGLGREGIDKILQKMLVFFLLCDIMAIVGILYMVATPIGNLGDITLRALETLKAVNVVAAEDTRHTLQLLTHYQIKKPLISCRVQNEKIVATSVIDLLKQGQNVAYCSDAGTPGISDPGAVLCKEVKAAGFDVVPIVGASAVTALMSVAGGGKSFVFDGFLSIKGGKRRTRLLELKQMYDKGMSIVLYESPYRILKLLADIADIFSESRVVIGRELTKLHEEIVQGKASELLQDFSGRQAIKGEFAVVITQ